MTTLLYRTRLRELLLLIRNGRLKTSSHGAKLLHCSQSTIKRMIKLLRDQHYDIVYDKKPGRYKDNTGEAENL